MSVVGNMEDVNATARARALLDLAAYQDIESHPDMREWLLPDAGFNEQALGHIARVASAIDDLYREEMDLEIEGRMYGIRN